MLCEHAPVFTLIGLRSKICNAVKKQKTGKIDILRVKKWFYVIDKKLWHILAKFKKILGTVFSQSPKNQEKHK